MPVLSFPCVVTRHDGASHTLRRRSRIKGHDLLTLALAATEQLALPADQCEYLLFVPKVPHPAGVFLEVVHGGHSALVGPMAGPTPPASVTSDSRYGLRELLTHVGLGPDGVTPRTYPVVVTYAGIFRDAACPPARNPIESDRRYHARGAAAESIRLERACHEGIHVVRYPVAPTRWTAQDLDRLLALAYRLLPTREPQWRESGAMLQEPFGTNDGRRTPALQYCLHVVRGDYAAYLRLPTFPTQALAEWLATRACQILLDQPVVRLNALSATPDASAEGERR